MPKLTRRETRTVRELARLLAALDAHAAATRPRRGKSLRTLAGPAR